MPQPFPVGTDATLVDRSSRKVCIIGGGPVGCSLGVMLSKHGFGVHIYERYVDIRVVPPPSGRSINLVLTNRGLKLADELGIRERLLDSSVKVSGRMMHSPDGAQIYQAYGRSGECNYSIDRSALNKFWLTEAENNGCLLHFDHAVSGLDMERSRVVFNHADGGSTELSLSQFDIVFGSDGAGSAVRASLVSSGAVSATEDMLSAGYKEVTFPAGPEGKYLMDANSLHIWARGSHMLMGLANLDGSFTGTIFMDREGSEASFERACESSQAAEKFWTDHYSDALELAGRQATVSAFVTSRVGLLGTVRCAPWHHTPQGGPMYCLIGDAAHAIVPFFGQGVNCGFEDVVVLKHLLSKTSDLLGAVSIFGITRKTDSDAIASLALENFEEMRSRVADAYFLFHKRVDGFVMNAFPTKYRTRYTMIMYSYNSYSVCLEFGVHASRFIDLVIRNFRLDESSDFSKDVDLMELERLIDEHITPVVSELGVSFEF